MDRRLWYPGQIVLDTLLLNMSKDAMLGLGMALRAILGTSTVLHGFTCAATAPASMQVSVGAGSIYSLLNVDNTAFGSLAADTTHQTVKQGINLDATLLSCPAPGTAGQSINYLISATYEDVDGQDVTEPFYNSTDPEVAYSGPGGDGDPSATVRQGVCSLTVTAGVPAATGSQSTPATPTGATPLYVVSVAYGQTTITSASIATVAGAPFITEPLTAKISEATGDARYLQSVNARQKLSANTTFYVVTTGSDSTGSGTSGAPWATIQKAINYLQQSIDLGGFIATISVANGTYAAASVAVPFAGSGTVLLQGNTATPTNCIINASSGDCIPVVGFGQINVAGFSLTAATGNGLSARYGGKINVVGPMNYGACGGAHMLSQFSGSNIVIPNGSYTVNGSATAHHEADEGGSIDCGNQAVNFTSPVTFSIATAVVSNGTIRSTASTFSGSTVTGLKFSASNNGFINTVGSGASYFPGSTSGSQASGGVYA